MVSHTLSVWRLRSTWYACGAIVLWGSLAPLGVSLGHVPPFFLTGIALLVGSVIGLIRSGFQLRHWKVPLRTLMLGVYGLFGFHFLLFMALRHAPALQANLINYLWPVGMVLLAPFFLPHTRVGASHVLAATLGFVGACLAILSGKSISTGFQWGYVFALGSAWVWASYSLLLQRVPPFSNAAVGLFALVSGTLAMLCHWTWESTPVLAPSDMGMLLLMGLGPLGGAFYLWDAALKHGDARFIGLLAFLTPLLSTVGLLVLRAEWPNPGVVLAATLIIAAAVVGSRAR